MSRETFTIAYDGPALRDGAMDVRDLAPALLALGQLLDAANTSLNGDAAKLKLQVKATEPGSFQIVLELIQSWTSEVLGVFASQEASGATNLLTWVLGVPTGAGGFIWLVKRLHGRQPDTGEKISHNTMRLTIDGEVIEIRLEVLRLYQDVAVRAAAQKLIEEPLKASGIDAFEVRKDGAVAARVGKDEAEFFGRPALPDEVLVDEIRRSAFSIVSLAFRDDNQWRLFDGNTHIAAAMADADFLRRVEANQISFAKGDILICDVRVVQIRAADGLRTAYTVERVVEHRPGLRQLPMPMPMLRAAP